MANMTEFGVQCESLTDNAGIVSLMLIQRIKNLQGEDALAAELGAILRRCLMLSVDMTELYRREVTND